MCGHLLAGIIGQTRRLAEQVAAHGVTVNAISPGRFDTALANRRLCVGRCPRCPKGNAAARAHRQSRDQHYHEREFFAEGINYRMNPTNIGCLAAASVDCCVLANNHVLDWGEAGLLETLDTLKRAGIPYAGAGRNAEEAATPAIIDVVSGYRIAVFAFGLESSGIPPSWNAGPRRPGVNTLPDIFAKTISGIVDRANAARRKGDLLVASVHWGSNWGYEIPLEHRVLAHELIDAAGFAVVHGHSSHHPLAIEIYRGRLILYGCGDFITDYEGIAGYVEYRNDLALLYLPEFAVPSGSLMALSMRPFRMQNFRLNCASTAEAAWLQAMLDRESARFGTHVAGKSDGTLSAVW